MAIPERVIWAVEVLAVRPSDQLLEIGCGRGTAVAMVCERLQDGQVLAIDRSATMVRLAEERNAAQVAAGRAAFRSTPLDRAELEAGRFDKVFAINVNLFWVRSAIKDLDVVRRALRPEGALYLFYEPPVASKAKPVAERVVRFLVEQGFTASTVTATTKRKGVLLGIVARPGSAGDQ